MSEETLDRVFHAHRKCARGESIAGLLEDLLYIKVLRSILEARSVFVLLLEQRVGRFELRRRVVYLMPSSN